MLMTTSRSGPQLYPTPVTDDRLVWQRTPEHNESVVLRMKMNDRVKSVLSEQYNKELFAAYLYEAIRIWANAEGWDGLESWMKAQVEEELEHAAKINEWILYRGQTTELKAVDAPEVAWSTPYEAMKAAYEHELMVSASIDHCAEVAFAEKDYATLSFLQWFIDEQAEEEDNTSQWVDKFEKVGDNIAGQFIVDSMLGKRED